MHSKRNSLFFAICIFLFVIGAKSQVNLSVTPPSVSYGFTSAIAIEADASGSISADVLFYLQSGVKKPVQLCPYPRPIDTSLPGGVGNTAFCSIADVSKFVPGTYNIYASVTPTSGPKFNTTFQTLTVTRQIPTLTLTASSNSTILFGTELSFDTSIQITGNGLSPKGNFTILRNGVSQTVIALNATWISPEIPVGTFSFTLYYSGDSNYAPAQTTITNSVADSVILTPLIPNPAGYGVSMTYNIRCSSPFITKLQVYDAEGTTPHYPIVCSQTEGAFAVPNFGIGVWTVIATWNGDSNHSAITTSYVQVIEQASSKISITTPPLTGSGSGVVLFEVLPDQILGSWAPATGTITVNFDGQVLLDKVPLTEGQYYQTINLADWNDSVDHTVIVTYSGDTNFKPASYTLFIPLVEISTTVSPYKDVSESIEIEPTTGVQNLKSSANSLGASIFLILFAFVGALLI